MPSRPLLFLCRLARVHQEARSSNLVRSRPLLKNVLSKCTPKNVLSKCTLRTCYQVHTQNVLPSAHPRTYYPSAHQERAIQVHTQKVLSKCTPKNVLSKCTLRTCYPSARYTRVQLVHHQSRAPLVLVHLSCITCTRAHISCTSTLVHPTRAPISCTHLMHPSRAPNSCITRIHAPISCTSTLVHPTRAPNSCTTNLVHPTRASLILVHHSRAPLSCTTNKLSQLSRHFPLPAWPSELLLVYHRAPLRNLVHHYVISCTIVHHSCSCTTPQSRAPLRNLVHLSCIIGSTHTTLVHCSRAPLTSLLNCCGTSHCLAVGSPTQEAPSTLVHHSNDHGGHC